MAVIKPLHLINSIESELNFFWTEILRICHFANFQQVRKSIPIRIPILNYYSKTMVVQGFC